MATRRISSACLAQSSRNAFLAAPRIHFRPHHIPRGRHFQTTSICLINTANTSAKRDPASKIIRAQSKLFKDADAAVRDLKSGSVILSAGFGLCGTAGLFNSSPFILYLTKHYSVSETIIAALERRGKDGLNNLTAVSNNAGAAGGGGLSPLVASGQIERLILSFLGANKFLEKKYLSGEIAIELCPQGTIAERIRAGGAGIPAFFTPTGISTSFISLALFYGF